MSYLVGRKDTKESARDAIVGLRQQLLMLEKKEEFLQKKMEDEQSKARANSATNKRCESGFRADSYFHSYTLQVPEGVAEHTF